MSNFTVKIINYQRVKKADLTFIPGLNVIVGESNQGKTAVLRSLETAIYNIPREEHISLGETKSAVGIKYSDHEVIWRRDKEQTSQVTYRIDGKIYSKLGRGQPKEVAEALGIAELDINERKFRLNFSKQMSYPFLLDSTPSDMFKFIAQSSGEDNLVEVLKQMKKDSSEMSSTVKAHEETQKMLGESLVNLEKRYKEILPKREYCEEVIALDSTVKKYQSLKESLETYKKCTLATEKMNNSLNYWKKTYNDIASSVSVMESHVKRREYLRNITDDYYSHTTSLIFSETELTRYKRWLDSVLELDDYYDRLRSQDSTQLKYVYLKESIEKYKELQSSLSEVITNASILDGKVERYNKFIESIGKVLSIKDEKESTVSYLKDTMSKVESCNLDINSYKMEVNYLNEVVSECTKEIESIGVCPYCGSILTGGEHEQHGD